VTFHKILLIVFITLVFSCKQKPTLATSEISNEIKQLNTVEDQKQFLEKILQDDQSVRNSEKEAQLIQQYGNDPKERLDYIHLQWNQDAINLAKVEAYLNKYGYPSLAELGQDAAIAPWIVIHHSGDIEERNRNFEILYQAYLKGDINDTAMSLYLGRTYQFQYNERFDMESPYRSEDEINILIDKLGLSERKEKIDRP